MDEPAVPDGGPDRGRGRPQGEAGTGRFSWDGRESDEECTGTGPWVHSGSYLVAAAARGSTELQEAVFVLGPAPGADDHADADADARAHGRPQDR